MKPVVSFTFLVILSLVCCLRRGVVTGQSLGIQMIQNAGKPCSQAFFNATGTALYNYVNTTTAQVLKTMGYTTQNFPVNPIQIINIVSARRGLLRGAGDDVEGVVAVTDSPDKLQSDNGLQRSESVPPGSQRDLATTVCTTCTQKGCVIYCFGCYLCPKRRRQLATTAPVSAALTAAAATAAKTAQTQIQKNITTYFKQWLTTGIGASLVNGCMTPTSLVINVTLF